MASTETTMELDVRAREETHVQRLPEPEQETIDQICQANGVSRINRFWCIVGRANDAGTVIHPSSAVDGSEDDRPRFPAHSFAPADAGTRWRE
jgi:hypothetical protein